MKGLFINCMQSISVRDAILREIISNSLAHRDYSSGYVAKMVIEKEIATYIGYKNLTYMTRTFLKPLLESKILEYTIPEKPKSRLQMYRTKE